MLIPAILSVLGASVLSDAKPEPRLYHTVFTWDNGGEIRRIFDVLDYIRPWWNRHKQPATIHLEERYFDYCIGDRHVIFSAFTSIFDTSKLKVDLFHTSSEDIDETSYEEEGGYEEEGARVCWVVLFYLGAIFYPNKWDFAFHHIGLPQLDRSAAFNSKNAKDHERYIKEVSSKQEPDGIDPYELTVYQTGQMQNSFFFMSTEDCLKVLGEK